MTVHALKAGDVRQHAGRVRPDRAGELVRVASDELARFQAGSQAGSQASAPVAH